MHHPTGPGPERSSSWQKPRKTLLLGLPAVLLAGAAAFWLHAPTSPQPAQSVPTAQPAAAPLPASARLADFRGEQPSPDARLVANWIATTHDNGKHAFVIVDKKEARVYAFTPDARLKDSTPALLGQARGDDILPGAGAKTPSQMRPEEKTTPAGRFRAEAGVNADHEDVIWVDYDDAISMHRVRPAVASEHRLERLASLATDDNRISFGCINLPVSFYEDVAKPVVKQYGAFVYVLPETRSVQQVFGAYDVTDPAQVAAAQQAQQAPLAVAARKAGATRSGAQG